MHGKRFAWHAVDQEADAGGVSGEASEIFGGDLTGVFAELLGEALCVVAADLEGNDGADVTEDSVGGMLVQLSQILVRDDQRQAVLAGFAEDGCETSGREILEFIDVEGKVTPFNFGDIRSGHSGLLNAGDQQRSEQRRIVFATSAFRQVHDQHLSSVHDVCRHRTG